MRVNRFASLLTIVALAWAAPVWAQAVDKAEKQAVIAKAGEELISRYIFPDRAGLAKAKIDQALAAGDYDTITDPRTFAERLTADLRSVTHDKHMQVFFPALNAGPPPPTSGAPKSNAGFLAVDRLKGNIGYINLRGFPDPAPFKLVADKAMADLSGTRAMIIDLRGNGGGDPTTVAYLCSFFFDPKTPVHLNDLVHREADTNIYKRDEFWTKPVPSSYRRKPVYLLTSGRTFSGGEEFVYDLKTQKRATVIGETTGGGANPGAMRQLNSRFGMFISGGRAENPITKTNWEGSGVAPDRAVGREQALRIAVLEITKDPALKKEEALEADAFSPVHLLKFRELPQPGDGDALKRLLGELARGEPDYSRLADDLTKDIKENLAQSKADLAAAGEIKTVTFKYTGPAGLDVYEVVCANGTLMSGIFVTPDGKVAANWFRLMMPERPTAVAQ